MLTFTSVALLLLVGILWPYATNEQLALDSIVCAGSILAASRAIHAQKRLMGWEFLGVALLFNPVLPVFRPPGGLSLIAVLITIAMIVACLIAVKTRALVSIQSIYRSQ
jgi:hypothetical protein